MRYLSVIPARGGSKEVPGKNIRLLGRQPLLKYTIDVARSVFNDETICLSTDSKEISNLAEKIGLTVPFLRPKKLAKDTSGMHEVLLHALDFYECRGYNPDAIVLLQPTSPFRTATHIKEALKLFTLDIDMVVSVKETESNPYYLLFEENKDGYLEKSKKGDFIRRQDAPKVWEYNGAIYVINASVIRKKKLNQFKKVRKYIMDQKSSIDIDTALDFDIAEFLLGNNVN